MYEARLLDFQMSLLVQAYNTRSWAIAERPRDAPCQLKPCEMSRDVRRIAFDKSCNWRMTFKVMRSHWKWRESIIHTNSQTFRPVVGQLSEVVLFLLLEQRCGMACQAMLRRPRRCRCSRTGCTHTCSAAASKLCDTDLHFFFLVIISPPEQWSLQQFSLFRPL